MKNPGKLAQQHFEGNVYEAPQGSTELNAQREFRGVIGSKSNGCDAIAWLHVS
jgi:hypothetical protein